MVKFEKEVSTGFTTSDPKETEGENTDIFTFCFFSSFHAARQPF